MIRVLLAEDQAMVRGVLAALLSLEEEIEIVAEAARGDEVVSLALATRPDVALLDIEMPGCDGITAAAALHAHLPSCRVLILTTFGRPGYLRRAMESNVVGFLVKDAPATQLATAIRRAMAGERVVDPALAAAALSEGHNPLTAREREVFARHRHRPEHRRRGPLHQSLRWHSAQLPLFRHPETGGAQQHGGGAYRGAEGLAVAGSSQ
jgi:two-component system, NarL family, response regulator DesR